MVQKKKEEKKRHVWFGKVGLFRVMGKSESSNLHQINFIANRITVDEQAVCNGLLSILIVYYNKTRTNKFNSCFFFFFFLRSSFFSYRCDDAVV